MLDTLPPSVPTGSARAARTAGKKLEFARQYCSQCPVPIKLISRHARSLDATRKLRRIRTHKKRNRESPKWIAVSGPMPESSRLRSSQRANGRYRCTSADRFRSRFGPELPQSGRSPRRDRRVQEPRRRQQHRAARARFLRLHHNLWQAHSHADTSRDHRVTLTAGGTGRGGSLSPIWTLVLRPLGPLRMTT